MSKERIELKPCPFCGGKAKFCINPHENSDTTQWHKIRCENTFKCGAELGTALSAWDLHYEEEIDELYERWNKRAECKSETHLNGEKSSSSTVSVRIARTISPLSSEKKGRQGKPYSTNSDAVDAQKRGEM